MGNRKLETKDEQGMKNNGGSGDEDSNNAVEELVQVTTTLVYN